MRSFKYPNPFRSLFLYSPVNFVPSGNVAIIYPLCLPSLNFPSYFIPSGNERIPCPFGLLLLNSPLYFLFPLKRYKIPFPLYFPPLNSPS